MKICYKCGDEKELFLFVKNKGICKSCKKISNSLYYIKNKQVISNYDKIRYENNREIILEKQKEYYQNNKKERIRYNKIYYQNNKELRLQYDKNYRINNKIAILEKNKLYKRQKRATDPLFKLRNNFSRMINYALNGKKLNYSIMNYLPYSIQELKNHLENQFDNKMSWDNYGSYWHVDHIIPQSKLIYLSMSDENFKLCWALSNLQPLEAIENIKKSNRII